MTKINQPVKVHVDAKPIILPNPLSVYKNNAEKYNAYKNALHINPEIMAYKSDDTTVPLSQMSWTQVEFIAGLWRVQDKTTFRIQKIRDKELIIGDKICDERIGQDQDKDKKMYFTYYQAQEPCFNCYGLINHKFRFNLVVSFCLLDDEFEYGYGKDVPSARAFLAVKVLDKIIGRIR